ncbi:MAG: beta-propeller fold lactonase family protein [Planctomycetota bacterium]
MIEHDGATLRRLTFLVSLTTAVGATALGGGTPERDLDAVRFVFVKTSRVIRKGLRGRPFELRLSAPHTNLYTVRGDGTGLKAITRCADASVRRPCVSFDGQRILFSMCPQGEHGHWDVYECNADGSGLRRLTRGPHDDIDPFYLPSGRIGFLSTRRQTLDEYHRELATLLYTMGPDGSNVRRISFNLSHDLHPRMLRDGRIAYVRWEHRNNRTHRFPLFAVRPDGTELFSYYGVRDLFEFAAVRDFCELGDGRLLVVATRLRPSAEPPIRFFGRLETADLAHGMDVARQAFGPRDGWLYRSPSTLPDGRVVAARGRRGSREGGVVVLSPGGRLERVVYDDPEMIELYPEPLVPRERPPVAPSYVDWRQETGLIASMSVFRSELRHDNGSLYQPMGSLAEHMRAVRVLEGLPARGESPRSRQINKVGDMPLNAEISLGEFPVFPDGSFAVEVPAGRPLVFQALDENGMSLTFHKSWVHVMPGERRLCMGCHEHRDHAPMNHMPLALQHPPARVADRSDAVSYSYVEDVRPILQAKCHGCHQDDGPRSLRGQELENVPYLNALRGPLADYVAPHYARYSYLVWKLYGRALSDGKYPPAGSIRDSWRPFRGTKMPPPEAPRLATEELRTIVVWVDLGARYGPFPVPDAEPPEAPTVPPSHPIVADEDPVDDRLGRRVPEGGSERDGRLGSATAPGSSEATEPAARPTGYDYQSPCRLCVSPDGKRLFASLATAGRVSVVDLTTRQVAREVAVGRQPAGLAVSPGGETLYVAVRGEHAVVAVDVAAGRVIERATVGYEPHGLALSPDGRLLLATNVLSDSVSVLATAPLRALTQVPVSRQPWSAAFTPAGDRALVANALSPQPATDEHVEAVVSVVDMDHGRVVAEVPTIDGNALRDVVVSPDGQWAYVAHQVPRANVPTTQIAQGWIQTNGLTVIGLGGEPRHVATVLLDRFASGAANPCGLAMAPDGQTLYVSHTGTHFISVVDLPRLHRVLAEREREAELRQDPGLTDPRDLARDLCALPRADVFRRWEAGGLGPRGIALSPAGDRLYVANFFSDTVTVLDTADGRLRHTLRLGPAKPMSQVRRGHYLFHDARHSCFQGWLGCASCHPETGADGLNWDLLNDGIGNRKNAKMLIGAMETPPAMSTGVRPSAEVAVAKGFQFIQFRQHTPDEQAAVVAYLRWVKHRPSPFHRQPDGSLDARAAAGKRLFHDPDVGCSECHPAPLFTDRRTYDVGTRAPEDRRDRFDTPSLREVYRTAPYLHSGAAATLGEVLTRFNAEDRHGRTSGLSRQQLDALVAYLRSL